MSELREAAQAGLPWWVRVAVLMAVAWGWVYLITDVIPERMRRSNTKDHKKFYKQSEENL